VGERPKAHDYTIDRRDITVPSTLTSPSVSPGSFRALLENAGQEVLRVSCWFDPATRPCHGETVTVRFSGQRIGVTGTKQPGDRFTTDETVDAVTAASGPISVTSCVRGVNPGDWAVTAVIVGQERPRGRRTGGAVDPPLAPAAWSWRRRKLYDGSRAPARTRMTPFARTPGIVPGVWPAMAALGVVVGLIGQHVVIARTNLHLSHPLATSVAGLVVGFLAAKVWFIVVHHRERSIEGWCVQGLVAGFVVVAAAAGPVSGLRIAPFLDVSAPGLFFGLAVGRLGCLFAGCCSGRATTSPWGVWSSDQRIGRRRIPTQLIESALAFLVAVASLIVVLGLGPAHGAVFAAAVSGYTLCRQHILLLRAEGRASARGSRLTSIAAAAVFAVATVFVAWR
jgi:phosphatidylglycerol:prolipoprotein diacylglycerol transferase